MGGHLELLHQREAALHEVLWFCEKKKNGPFYTVCKCRRLLDGSTSAINKIAAGNGESNRRTERAAG